MTTNQPTIHQDADLAHELREIGEEFGCVRLQGESTPAYGLRLLEYISEMTSEMRAVEERIRSLITSADRSQ
jgi:hypothetical protein